MQMNQLFILEARMQMNQLFLLEARMQMNRLFLLEARMQDEKLIYKKPCSTWTCNEKADRISRILYSKYGLTTASALFNVPSSEMKCNKDHVKQTFSSTKLVVDLTMKLLSARKITFQLRFESTQ